MQSADYTSFTVSNASLLKQKMLNWAKRFNIFCFLDNCNYSIDPHQYECLLAAGTQSFISSQTSSFKAVDHFIKEKWAFGHLSYELKNQFFNFSETKKDAVDFPLFYFFEPQVLIALKGDELRIYSKEADLVYKEIDNATLENDTSNACTIHQKLNKEQYVQKIKSLQNHIKRGDCYEINFCQEFFAEDAFINPYSLYQNLNKVSPNPFSAIYKLEDKYLICASPERFVTKEGNKIFSQPIKGTAARNLLEKEKDELLKKELFYSAKERAENVMVVDLVRNDLSKICKASTVKVDELFGIYSFPQVHQMISTISGELMDNKSFSDIIESIYPMGSMTGAPKHKVLQLIDEYETSARGIFSGSVGYINPNGDFDFNVVIRSIMYNASNKYLSYQVGSGITYYSDAEREWEECLLKAQAIKKVLGV